MSRGTEATFAPVLPEEVARRVAEYRQMGFEKKAKPLVVYHDPWVLCPWAGCGFKIAGIDFHLEAGDQDQYAAWLTEWWQGAGLVGRCPGCHRFVLFTINDKQCVIDPAIAGLGVLPDDWFERAYTIRHHEQRQTRSGPTGDCQIAIAT